MIKDRSICEKCVHRQDCKELNKHFGLVVYKFGDILVVIVADKFVANAKWYFRQGFFLTIGFVEWY